MWWPCWRRISEQKRPAPFGAGFPLTHGKKWGQTVLLCNLEDQVITGSHGPAISEMPNGSIGKSLVDLSTSASVVEIATAVISTSLSHGQPLNEAAIVNAAARTVLIVTCAVAASDKVNRSCRCASAILRRDEARTNG